MDGRTARLKEEYKEVRKRQNELLSKLSDKKKELQRKENKIAQCEAEL